MNPLSLRCTNYRTFASLELDLPAGAVAISGPNGAGKSTLIEAIELALYGQTRTGSLAAQLARGSEGDLEIELTFEHAGYTYRVRRGYSARGRGKTALDFEKSILHRDAVGGEDPEVFVPLTRETQKETQAAIEALIGLSRETFRASCFLAQKDAGAFTEAAPRERKAILAEVMRLDTWADLLERARVDKRVAEREREQIAGRIALLEEQGGDPKALADQRDWAAGQAGDAEEAHRHAEGVLNDAAEKVAAIERTEASYKLSLGAVESAKAKLSERQSVVDRAAEAKRQAVEVQRQLSEAGDPSTRLAELEDDLAEMNAARERRRAAEAERDRLLMLAQQAERESEAMKLDVQRAILNRQTSIGKVAALQEAGNEHTCDRCGQEIHGEAFQRTVDSLVAEREEMQRHHDEITARFMAVARRQGEAKEAAAAVAIPDGVDAENYEDVVGQIATARQSELALAGLRQGLLNLEHTIAEAPPELTAEVARLSAELVDAEAALAAIEEPEPGRLETARAEVLRAKARHAETTSALAESRASLVRAEAALEAAQKIAEELGNCRLKQAELLGEIDLLSDCERAYGPNGVPAHIVENRAIPSIETEANRILEALPVKGTTWRVELHTQRALKSGDGLADTLDVVVQTDTGPAPYESFSGGEGARLNIALRLALARLLTNRRGAESKLLVLDEVAYLDDGGKADLVEVVLGLRAEFDRILVVSHESVLRDAPLDAVIEVVNEDGRSRVVGAVEREAVPA